MKHTFHLLIRTPEQKIYDGEIKNIYFTTEEFGITGVYANHASMTSTILFSNIRIQEETGQENFLARRGIFTFSNETNEALLLCQSCEKMTEMTYVTALEYLKFIEEKLARHEDLSQFQLVHLEEEKLAVTQQIKSRNKKL